MKSIFVSTKKYGVKEVLVDEQDYEFFSSRNISIYKGANTTNTFYASIRYGGKVISIHRLIMGDIPEHLMVDHINRNGLDNRRENLRLANATQNGANRTKVKTASSKYMGVYRGFSTSSYKKQNGEVMKYKSYRWRVCVGSKKHGKKSFGSFKTEEEAARAYDKKAIEMWGEFANLNFPEELNK